MALIALLAIATGVFLVLCLMLVGLIETPWPVLLGGLLLAFYGLQRLSLQNPVPPPIEVKQADPFKGTQAARTPSAPVSPATSDEEEALVYRGVRYNPHKPPLVTDNATVVEGIYRGQRWHRFRRATPASQDKNPRELPDNPSQNLNGLTEVADQGPLGQRPDASS